MKFPSRWIALVLLVVAVAVDAAPIDPPRGRRLGLISVSERLYTNIFTLQQRQDLWGNYDQCLMLSVGDPLLPGPLHFESVNDAMVLNEHRPPQEEAANARYPNNATVRKKFLKRQYRRCRDELRVAIQTELKRMDTSELDGAGWDDLPLNMRSEKPQWPSLNQIRPPNSETLQGFTHAVPALSRGIQEGLVRGESIPRIPLMP